MTTRRAPPIAGPVRWRTSEAIFARAWRVAARCGVTRLADITRLDRIGLPVWQAVRPAGRALSIHQGKGTTPLAAKIGALCEAVESHYAEQAPADGPLCPAEALPDSAGAPALDDLLCDRSRPPEPGTPIQWCSARNLADGTPALLPHDLVSLDFTRSWRSRFDRSSGGLGAGVTSTGACEKAILELLENDAVGRWDRSDLLSRMSTQLDPDSVPHRWFHAWREHLHGLDMQLRLCAMPAVTGHPVLYCALLCRDRTAGIATFTGASCHGNAGIALHGALAEAIQSRLTFIAGARDDMLPSHYETPPGALPGIGPIPPPAPGFPMVAWQSIANRPGTLADLVADLSRAGLNQVLCKTLSPPGSEIAVVKAFVPGLGSLRRTGRDAPCA